MGTIEDDDEIENDDIDSEEDEVRLEKLEGTLSSSKFEIIKFLYSVNSPSFVLHVEDLILVSQAIGGGGDLLYKIPMLIDNLPRGFIISFF